jgi:hypothetical protein
MANLVNELNDVYQQRPAGVDMALIVKKRNKIIFAQNANKPFYAASLSKIPICLYVLKEGFVLDEKISLQVADVISGTGWMQYAPLGTKLKLKQLLYLVLAESDNTATKALVRFIGGPQLINDWLKADYKITKLEIINNKNGKFYFGDTSAQEITSLFEELLKYPLAVDYLKRNRFDWGLRSAIDPAHSPRIAAIKDNILLKRSKWLSGWFIKLLLIQKRPAAEYPNKDGSWESSRHEVAQICDYTVAILTDGYNPDLPYNATHPAFKIFSQIGKTLKDV